MKQLRSEQETSAAKKAAKEAKKTAKPIKKVVKAKNPGKLVKKIVKPAKIQPRATRSSMPVRLIDPKPCWKMFAVFAKIRCS